MALSSDMLPGLFCAYRPDIQHPETNRIAQYFQCSGMEYDGIFWYDLIYMSKVWQSVTNGWRQASATKYPANLNVHCFIGCEMITCCGGWFVFHASVDCTAQIFGLLKTTSRFLSK